PANRWFNVTMTGKELSGTGSPSTATRHVRWWTTTKAGPSPAIRRRLLTAASPDSVRWMKSAIASSKRSAADESSTQPFDSKREKNGNQGQGLHRHRRGVGPG